MQLSCFYFKQIYDIRKLEFEFFKNLFEKLCVSNANVARNRRICRGSFESKHLEIELIKNS